MNNLTKRLVWGSMLGVLFGALCFAGFSSNQDMPAEFAKWQVWSWSNTMMWFTISNRFLLGVVVAMTGFITVHLMCNLKLSAWLRGIIGFLVSLSMAI
jgi:hypothetical protein